MLPLKDFFSAARVMEGVMLWRAQPYLRKGGHDGTLVPCTIGAPPPIGQAESVVSRDIAESSWVG